MTLRAILLGSKPGSIVALNHLIERGWEVTEVVASEENAEWTPKPGLWDHSKSLGIKTVARQQELTSTDVDLVISYMFRSKVNSTTLSRGRIPLNFHAAPLPRYGGWAFYNVAILEGAKEYGCTCHVMDSNFDTGPLVKVRTFEIDHSKETAISLEKKAQLEMAMMFREVIDEYSRSGILQNEEQDPNLMRYLTLNDLSKLKAIPPGASAEEIERIARAFWYPPYECAFYELPGGVRVEVVPASVRQELGKVLHENDLRDLLENLTGDVASLVTKKHSEELDH